MLAKCVLSSLVLYLLRSVDHTECLEFPFDYGGVI